MVILVSEHNFVVIDRRIMRLSDKILTDSTDRRVLDHGQREHLVGVVELH